MKITFQSESKEFGKNISSPVPSRTTIPEWYKKMPPHMDGSKKAGFLQNSLNSNRTLTACLPFLDAMTTGYTYVLPVDVEISVSNGNMVFKWRIGGDVITPHSREQYPGMPPAVGSDGQVMKWGFPFHISVPSGYSVLFSHPFNRHDLPFRTFTGIVDCDKHSVPISFPFEMITPVNERMIIERGTPVCQMFPFKRENWNSETKDYDSEESSHRFFKLHSKIVQSYKNQFWTRKTYE